MRIGKLLAAAALICAPVAATPVVAQDSNFDELDRQYLACLDYWARYNMGTPNQASTHCYVQIYGREGGGGGGGGGAPTTVICEATPQSMVACVPQ